MQGLHRVLNMSEYASICLNNRLYACINIYNCNNIIIVTNVITLEFLSAQFVHPGALKLTIFSFLWHELENKTNES